jgi:hypothetical protein
MDSILCFNYDLKLYFKRRLVFSIIVFTSFRIWLRVILRRLKDFWQNHPVEGLVTHETICIKYIFNVSLLL